MKVKVRRLVADLPLPSLGSAGSAGFDLNAALDKPLLLAPGSRALVPTGLQLEIPVGWEAQVRPRSGLALRHGVTVLNSPGTIDSDYRGEVGVILIHLGDEALTFKRGDRIAQLVFSQVASIELEEAESLSSSKRGSGGFGSTGR